MLYYIQININIKLKILLISLKKIDKKKFKE